MGLGLEAFGLAFLPEYKSFAQFALSSPTYSARLSAFLSGNRLKLAVCSSGVWGGA